MNRAECRLGISHFRLWLKVLGAGSLLLILLLTVILPLINRWIVQNIPSREEAIDWIQLTSLLVLPILVCVGPILIARPFLEEPYCELLRQITGATRQRALQVGSVFTFFYSLTLLILLIWQKIGYIRPAFSAALSSYLLFMFGLTYWVIVQSKSSSLSFFTLFAFSIIGFLYHRDLPFFPFLGNINRMDLAAVLPRLPAFVISAVLLFALAEHRETVSG